MSTTLAAGDVIRLASNAGRPYDHLSFTLSWQSTHNLLTQQNNTWSSLLTHTHSYTDTQLDLTFAGRDGDGKVLDADNRPYLVVGSHHRTLALTPVECRVNPAAPQDPGTALVTLEVNLSELRQWDDGNLTSFVVFVSSYFRSPFAQVTELKLHTSAGPARKPAVWRGKFDLDGAIHGTAYLVAHIYLEDDIWYLQVLSQALQGPQDYHGLTAVLQEIKPPSA